MTSDARNIAAQFDWAMGQSRKHRRDADRAVSQQARAFAQRQADAATAVAATLYDVAVSRGVRIPSMEKPA